MRGEGNLIKIRKNIFETFPDFLVENLEFEIQKFLMKEVESETFKS